LGVRQVPNVPYNERLEAKAAGQEDKGKEAIAATQTCERCAICIVCGRFYLSQLEGEKGSNC